MGANLVLVRIDDRLIHGQVAVGWVKATTPDTIVVANDAVAKDAMQRSLMELACPQTLSVKICRVDEVALLLHGPSLDKKRVLLLFASPQDVLAALETGLKFSELNIGGMRFAPGKQQVLKAVSLNESDRQALRQLKQAGLHITMQMVPTDEKLEIDSFVNPPNGKAEAGL
jgi:mannose/fructose/sorbose-specific phosphotransferase system IIB component